jgi:hypothetical protein
MNLQTLFTFLITLQFVMVVFHDLVDIPGWTLGSQVKAVVGRRKLLLATLINAVFPGLAVAFAIYFWQQPGRGIAVNCWLIYCAVTLVSAIAMWYVPYFLGASQKHKSEYSRMYAGTRQVLPPRGDNPRPNLLHLCFHVLFVVNFVLSLILRFQNA